MKNKQIFKMGDRVFDVIHGWGEVIRIYSTDWENLPLEHLVCGVKFNNGAEGHYTKHIALKILSFTEYGFDKRFSQKRPVNYKDYEGKWGKFWDDEVILISKLVFYDDAENENYPFESEFNCHMNFEPLTEEQVKILELE